MKGKQGQEYRNLYRMETTPPPPPEKKMEIVEEPSTSCPNSFLTQF